MRGRVRDRVQVATSMRLFIVVVFRIIDIRSLTQAAVDQFADECAALRRQLEAGVGKAKIDAEEGEENVEESEGLSNGVSGSIHSSSVQQGQGQRRKGDQDLARLRDKLVRVREARLKSEMKAKEAGTAVGINMNIDQHRVL